MANLKWARYFFQTDFTPYAADLTALEKGTILDEATGAKLLEVLKSADTGAHKDDWTFEADVECSLSGAVVRYNRVNNEELPTKLTAFNRCCVLLLPTYEGDDARRIYLQYNVEG